MVIPKRKNTTHGNEILRKTKRKIRKDQIRNEIFSIGIGRTKNTKTAS